MLTSDNCSTKASMAFNSPWRCGTWASVTAIRARCAIRRTVASSTDIIYGLKSDFSVSPRIAEGAFAPQPAQRRDLSRLSARKPAQLCQGGAGQRPGQLGGRHFTAESYRLARPEAR